MKFEVMVMVYGLLLFLIDIFNGMCLCFKSKVHIIVNISLLTNILQNSFTVIHRKIEMNKL